MFKFTIKGRTYTTVFYHTGAGKQLPNFIAVQVNKPMLKAMLAGQRLSFTSIHEGNLSINDIGQDNLLSTGYAICHAKDNFSRKMGRKTSFQRALKVIFPTQKNIRKAIWDKYFKQIENKEYLKNENIS